MENEFNDLKEQFKGMDLNGDGMLSKEEIKIGFEKLGKPMSE